MAVAADIPFGSATTAAPSLQQHHPDGRGGHDDH